MATLLVSESLAKVNDKRGSTEEGGLHDKLLKLQDETKTKTKNIWNKDEKHHQKHTRSITFFSD